MRIPQGRFAISKFRPESPSWEQDDRTTSGSRGRADEGPGKMNPEIQAIINGVLGWWSIIIQLGVVSVLTILLLVTWIVTRRKVISTWLVAWSFDSLGLILVLIIASAGSFLGGETRSVLFIGYSTAKVLFALFLILGLFRYRRNPFAMGKSSSMAVMVLAAFWGIILLIFFRGSLIVQLATYAMVCMLFFGGGFSALFDRRKGARVLGAALLVHGLVFLHHFLVMMPSYLGFPTPAYMSRISFVDAVSEFLVGLACSMAAGLRAVEDMEQANRRLEASERTLRSLVDSDPLTGLYNRRRLRRFFESISGPGTVLFIDIDRFKGINDAWGHTTGDTCLLRVAENLREVFRTEDGLFRLGGDEFLVVAPGLIGKDVAARVARLRKNLSNPDDRGIALNISVGDAVFDDSLRPDEAMAMADAAMYRDKKR